MNSIWTKTTDLPEFPTLPGDKKTDVLIIGGGMAGILCAYFLQERGVPYILAEGGRICSGVTQDTTAKITAQHGLLYADLLRREGVEKARMYLNANQEAVRNYARLCEGIECDFEEKTSYLYSVDDRRKLEEEADALQRLGYTARISETSALPFQTAGAIGFAHQAQFHPLKFVAQIAQKLSIYENTFVTGFRDHTAITDKGNIIFKKLIFATHFPIDNKHGMYFMKMYQERSYVIALSGAPQVEGMYMDINKRGLSFRNYRDLLLFGGESHRTGKDGGKWQALREKAGRFYPDAREKYAWAAQDCITLDGVPYIGAYALGLRDCFVATGFNKWGMTSSMVSAAILSDMATGVQNPYQAVFYPSRRMKKLQLLINGWEALTSLLTPSKKRCPHLGCALKWNQAEHSWDCPCHGSRFDKNGRVLCNPANGDLTKRDV